MKYIITILMMLGLGSLALAQKPAAPALAPVKAEKTMHMGKETCPMSGAMAGREQKDDDDDEGEEEEGMKCPHQGKMGQGAMMNKCDKMDRCPQGPMACMQMGRPFGRLMPLFICVKLMAAFMFFLLALNILLTILVVKDMGKRNAFNGLWIPIILIGSIPATVAYAIWRMGDGKQG